MPPELSLYWIARLTASLYRLSADASSEHDIAKELEQTPRQAMALLERARESGFVEGEPGAWKLAGAGWSVGQRAAHAHEQAAGTARSLHYRAYTGFLPNGKERLGVGGS